MIKTIKITSGYASELPCLKGRTFEFKPKVNVLFGDNGSGKSTIMKIIAGYSGIDANSPYSPGGWNGARREFHRKPDIIGNCKAEIERTGEHTLYQMTQADAPLAYFSDGGNDGLSSFEEQVTDCTSRISDGEKRFSKLMSVFKSIEKESATRPDMTIMLDEPDRGLTFNNQFLLWQNFIPKISKYGQVIIASHSIVPILMGYNTIQMEEGSVEKNLKCLNDLSATHTEIEKLKESLKRKKEETQTTVSSDKSEKT
jgi:predicted ATPase